YGGGERSAISAGKGGARPARSCGAAERARGAPWGSGRGLVRRQGAAGAPISSTGSRTRPGKLAVQAPSKTRWPNDIVSTATRPTSARGPSPTSRPPDERRARHAHFSAPSTRRTAATTFSPDGWICFRQRRAERHVHVVAGDPQHGRAQAVEGLLDDVRAISPAAPDTPVTTRWNASTATPRSSPSSRARPRSSI